MNRLGVINVYDPTTGWATHPVASIAWNDDGPIFAEWVPLDVDAREVRYATLHEMTPQQQAKWLNDHIDDPTMTRAVDLVEPDIPTADAQHHVESLMSEVLRFHAR